MTRKRPSPYLEIVLFRLNVFVPALMSVGFLFWLAALVRDQLRRRRALTLERRAITAGRAAGAITLGHRPSLTAKDTGLAERRVYLFTALPFLGLAVYVLIGAVGNYFRPNGYVRDIAWLLALSLLLSLGFAAVGIVLALVSYQWPTLSPGLRQIAARTPIGGLPEGDTPFTRPSPALNAALALSASAAVLIAMVVGSSRGFLVRIDEPILDAAADAQWLDVVAAIDPLGSTVFTVMAAALLGLASFRCRPLVAAYPLAMLTAFTTHNALKAIIERERPPGGDFAGRFDSFPSGHLSLATVLVGLLPLTVAVMIHSDRFLRPMRVLAAATIVGAAAHRLHDQAHWPTDALGALLIGSAIVLGVEWVMAHEAWHRRCTDCPWAPTVDLQLHGPGTVPMSVDRAQLAGYLSHGAAGLVAITLAVLTMTTGLPSDPEGLLVDPTLQRVIQLGLAGVVSVAALISWKWTRIGAVLMALAAGGLGTFAALQYRPPIAMAVAIGVAAPAVLLWLSWQSHRTPREVAGLALFTTLGLFATWVGASQVYASVFGPTHEDSAALRVPIDRVEWVWLGGLGARSVEVSARLEDDDHTVRLVATSAGRTWASPDQVPDNHDLARFALHDLEPDRYYSYMIEVDGRPDEGRGRGTFRTPAEGATSFRMVAASCARTDSNAAVFDAIAAEDPLLYLALGDIHYSNIAENNPALFRAAYDRMLSQPGQANLNRDVPMAYVWDDHDYGPNDADGSSPSRDAARQVFRETVPSHRLASEDGAIHRAFTIGRVRFVVTDTRSDRGADTMLGADQLSWLEAELVTASADHGLVVWMNPAPWIGPASAGGDGWSGFAAERERIANVIAEHRIDNVLMVSGDAHMLAFDDGTNSAYAADGSGGFPVLHAAALDRPGSIKGGPYSGGAFPGFGQYGVIDVIDDGDAITVSVAGKNWKGEELFTEELSFPG